MKNLALQYQYECLLKIANSHQILIVLVMVFFQTFEQIFSLHI